MKKKGKTENGLQAGGWKHVNWWNRQSFSPPISAIVGGSKEALFRGYTEGYPDHTGAPFLKFELETMRHRIAFGIYPKPGDENLSVADVTHLTWGVGKVKFASAASYVKPNCRTISRVELSPVERLANMTELQIRHAESRRDACDMLTIREAADYARVNEKTIRDWLTRRDGDKFMLPGAIKAGRKFSIPRADLDPWRKAAKATRTPKTPPRKRTARKVVKRKS